MSALQLVPVAQAALLAWPGVERGVSPGAVVVRQVMAMRRGSTAGRLDPLMTGYGTSRPSASERLDPSERFVLGHS